MLQPGGQSGQTACNQGTVVHSEGGWARVEVARGEMCDGCSESGSCGSRLDGRSRHLAVVRDPVGAHQGDRVEISIAEGVVLWGTVVLYLLPVISLLVFLFAALYLNSRLGWGVGENLIAVSAGVLGLLFSLPVVRFLSTRWKYLSEGGPEITRILPLENSDSNQGPGYK